MAFTIDRYRDKQTGLFSGDTIETVRCLQSKFSNTRNLVLRYLVKNFCQVLVGLICLIVSGLVYINGNFEELFECEFVGFSDLPNWFLAEISGVVCTNFSDFNSSDSVLPDLPNTNLTLKLSTNITRTCLDKPFQFRCTFEDATFLGWLHTANYSILLFIFFVCLYNCIPVWFIVRFNDNIQKITCGNVYDLHWHDLDYEIKAMVFYYVCSRQAEWKEKKRLRFFWSDLYLMVMMLFANDEGYGTTFCEVQFDIELHSLWEKDYKEYVTFQNQLLLLSDCSDWDYRTEKLKEILDPDNDAFFQYDASAQRSGASEYEDIFSQTTNNYEKFAIFSTKLGFWHLIHTLAKRKDKCYYKCGLHLFCGSRGATLNLSYLCRFLVSVDFNTNFDPPQSSKRSPDQDAFPTVASLRDQEQATLMTSTKEETLFREDFGALQIFTVPDTIMMARDASRLLVLLEQLKTAPTSRNSKYDFVVVSRLEPPDRIATTQTVLLNMADCFHDDCIFLFFCPDEITLKKIVKPIQFLKPLHKTNIQKFGNRYAEKNVCFRTYKMDRNNAFLRNRRQSGQRASTAQVNATL
ncbi:uncharacterized protein LOC134185808 isoform X2 [Corticium candelabrum]|nr:uncharacterized protein LOC134185808 isoform X2 [Corticium candelabrum]